MDTRFIGGYACKRLQTEKQVQPLCRKKEQGGQVGRFTLQCNMKEVCTSLRSLLAKVICQKKLFCPRKSLVLVSFLCSVTDLEQLLGSIHEQENGGRLSPELELPVDFALLSRRCTRPIFMAAT